jgi:2-keto-4-pentenoate hydratase/2-oxohepta-3-ene-1,7-dioic acid hydratase in catechol pathway
MKLATFTPGQPTEPSPGWTAYPMLAGEVRGEEVVAFEDHRAVHDALMHGVSRPAKGEAYALADVTLHAPITPRAIFGIGLNYADHAAETGREAPEAPIVFMKLPRSSTAPNQPVEVPQAAMRRLDYEGELAIVIGGHGKIAGYAIADDLSARDLQGREPQWTRAKGFDNSCPWGPWITTADEVGDPVGLSLKTWVNGDLRQDGTTADLIFKPQQLVDFISETCTLQVGDLILTGTPAGVGMAMDPRQFLASGDVVRIEIEKLGAIEHAIV